MFYIINQLETNLGIKINNKCKVNFSKISLSRKPILKIKKLIGVIYFTLHD